MLAETLSPDELEDAAAEREIDALRTLAGADATSPAGLAAQALAALSLVASCRAGADPLDPESYIAGPGPSEQIAADLLRRIVKVARGMC